MKQPEKIEFFREDMTILLKLEEVPKNEDIQAVIRKYELFEKHDLHITIIGMATGRDLIGKCAHLSAWEQEVIWKKIRDIAHSIDWRIQLLPQFFHIEKEYTPTDKRWSIIQAVHLHGLDEFYEHLNTVLNETFSPPFPHITLATSSTREDKKLRGIGIYSEQDFYLLNPQPL